MSGIRYLYRYTLYQIGHDSAANRANMIVRETLTLDYKTCKQSLDKNDGNTI